MHAATFLRQRLVVLDRELVHFPGELKRIWIHELYHFVWWRASNRTRHSWEQLLLSEKNRGELGWSAQWRKNKLTRTDRELCTRAWRDYCCESFCDTAAWILCAMPKHPEATLAARAGQARTRWFAIIDTQGPS